MLEIGSRDRFSQDALDGVWGGFNLVSNDYRAILCIALQFHWDVSLGSTTVFSEALFSMDIDKYVPKPVFGCC